MTTMIPLETWVETKTRTMSFRQAYELFDNENLVGAVKIDGVVMVPEDLFIKGHDFVSCMICNRMFPQITGTHLKQHEMSVETYKQTYPKVDTISQQVLDTIKAKSAGKKASQITKDKISEGRKGIVPKNHPAMFQKGHSPSDEIREKMSVAQTGRKHSEETKAKIGDAHRGKIVPRSVVEKQAEWLRSFYKTHIHPNRGKTRTDAIKTKLSTIALKREAGYSAEKKQAISVNKSVSLTGKKRTEEQKQTYRIARCKVMVRDAHKRIPTAGEQTIKHWLEVIGLEYVFQYNIPNRWHPYDFYVPSKNLIIEFDGSHHWKGVWFGIAGKTQEEIDELLARQLRKDARNNHEAWLHGYRIIRLYGIADVGDVGSIEHWGSFEEQLANQGYDMNLDLIIT